ncbi:methylated-DNA--[protein]-cysteine S-methyltransferase [Companilactobacillus hulinensis]|uniref:methylated-DNA--[protein]-cysteine S-methyltransferase n=1 Tax=Companilactobacillus hulinensis TaxID=2486007 RepID=UPI000F789935|nr:methylated-DNA--[protein]-cysteine S-methyltransferase [Companilactobacillus hulinensis]
MTKTIYYEIKQIHNHKYVIAATAKGLAFVGSPDKEISEIYSFYQHSKLIEDDKVIAPYYRQLKEFMDHKRTSFELSTDVSGTDFQEQVWHAVQDVPYGSTSNYSEIASTIGRPKAVRAVGTAIGRNPILMVIPCHRILTKDNKLGGFRAGLEMKKELLELESSNK